jgi:hypothetical protein
MVPPSRTRMRVRSYSTLSMMLKFPTTQYMVWRCPLSRIGGYEDETMAFRNVTRYVWTHPRIHQDGVNVPLRLGHRSKMNFPIPSFILAPSTLTALPFVCPFPLTFPLDIFPVDLPLILSMADLVGST